MCSPTPQICLWPPPGGVLHSCTWPSWCRKYLGLVAPLAAHGPPPAALLQQAGMLFRHFGPARAHWTVGGALFVSVVPSRLLRTCHRWRALWRPEALARWNGDFSWPQPAEHRRHQRWRPAAGTVPSTAAVPLLACGYASLRVRLFALLASERHRHFPPAKPGTGYFLYQRCPPLSAQTLQ